MQRTRSKAHFGLLISFFMVEMDLRMSGLWSSRSVLEGKASTGTHSLLLTKDR